MHMTSVRDGEQNSPAVCRVMAGVSLALFALFLAALLRPVLTTPFDLHPGTAWTLICAVFAVPVLVMGWIRGHRLPLTAFDYLLAAYVGSVLLTWPTSLDRTRTGAAIIVLVADIAVFYAVRTVAATRPTIARLVVAAFVSGFALLQWLATDYHLLAGLGERLVYYGGLDWNGRQGLGSAAAIQFALLIGVCQQARTRPVQLGSLFLLVAAAVQLLFFYSRDPWVASAAVLLLSLIVAVRRGGFGRWVVAVGAIVAVVVVVSNPYIVRLAKMAIGIDDAVEHGVEGGLRLRWATWEYSGVVIRQHPFVGVGLNNFVTRHDEVYPDPVPAVFRGELIDPALRNGPVHPHNLYLQQAAEVGVFGGLAYAALWMVVLWAGWTLAIERDARPAAPLALFYAVAAIAVMNFGENIFLDTVAVERMRLHTIAWVAMALIVEEWARRRSAVRHPSPAVDLNVPRWIAAAACAASCIYAGWIVFREMPAVAIQGRQVRLADDFGKRVPLTQTFQMIGPDLSAIDVRLAADPPATVLVRCDVSVIESEKSEPSAPPRTFWLTVRNVADPQWHRLALPALATAKVATFVVRLRLAARTPADGPASTARSSAPDGAPRVAIAVSDDNVLGGGQLYIDDKRQLGSLSMRAYTSAPTAWVRLRNTLDPALPPGLGNRAVFVAVMIVGYQLAFVAVMYTLLTGAAAAPIGAIREPLGA
jgi:O-antigen ligase/polysaccharide polymerase Wzy-like membrane protein